MTRRLRVVAIVEGAGEVEALPVLLRRIGLELLGDVEVEALKPFQMKGRSEIVSERRSKLPNAIDTCLRKLESAQRPTPSVAKLLLILIDADGECPVLLMRELRARPEIANARGEVAIVVATRNYETWLVGGASGFADLLKTSKSLPPDPEIAGLGESWLKANLRRGVYSKTVDQRRLSGLMDLAGCRQGCPSFDKLCRELARAAGVP